MNNFLVVIDHNTNNDGGNDKCENARKRKKTAENDKMVDLNCALTQSYVERGCVLSSKAFNAFKQIFGKARDDAGIFRNAHHTE